MAFDPVCGMQVDEKTAVHLSRHRGETYWFCSARCKDRFERAATQYLQHPQAWGDEGRKVVIVGAGEVGATFAYALMISGLATSIVLIDKDTQRAEGHVMDLNHGLSFVKPCKIFVGGYEDCKDAVIVAITAGAAQKPGETRLDLARKNADIFGSIIPEIAKFTPRILLVVANPVDVLTYVALKLSGYPMSRVMGSGTILDTARFRYLLSEHCCVDPRNVHAHIVGEHGDSELALWSKANIGGVPLANYCPTCRMSCPVGYRTVIFEKAKNAAYEIIQRKGATNYAIGLALVRICEAILRDENSVLTVSSLVDDYYGISDVCLSVPVILNRTGIVQTLKVDMETQEIEQLKKSAAILKDTIKALGV